MTQFRLAKVANYRRIFGHPASIFFERGIANLETLEISSLSAEPCEGSSFIVSVFDIPPDQEENFRIREEEFNIVLVSRDSLDL